MDNIVSILASAFLSGLLVCILTFWWQHKNQQKERELKIFTVLMSQRYMMSSKECVEAFNMIDVVFYKSKIVRSAWREMLKATNLPYSEANAQNIIEKYHKLLEAMAKHIGYKNITWEDIEKYYNPETIQSQITEEFLLRKNLIEALKNKETS